MMWGLIEGHVDPGELLAQTPNDTSHDHFAKNNGFIYVQHCFDYIRQGIQCAGDMTLEAPTNLDGKPLYNGWGTAQTILVEVAISMMHAAQFRPRGA
jgi:hypothetical protein